MILVTRGTDQSDSYVIHELQRRDLPMRTLSHSYLPRLNQLQ